MSIYDYSLTTRKGEEVSLKNFEGKVMLVVNTATGCGFTPQYEQLEEMYEKYHDRGFEIIDVPAARNDFIYCFAKNALSCWNTSLFLLCDEVRISISLRLLNNR